MTEAFDTLAGTLDHVWATLAGAVQNPEAPARNPVFGTTRADGSPTMRTVVLRAVDPVAGTLEFHTDTASSKVAETQRDPRGAFHIWDRDEALQIRIAVTVTHLSPTEAFERWSAIPEGPRRGYGRAPQSGTRIQTYDGYSPGPDANRFTGFVCTAEAIETLLIDPGGHRRAEFLRASGWQGAWLVP
ncbi:MAG: pyridoxamine 5'-phosphate oxidase family protein [Pseudomonadota bacterium]